MRGAMLLRQAPEGQTSGNSACPGGRRHLRDWKQPAPESFAPVSARVTIGLVAERRRRVCGRFLAGVPARPVKHRVATAREEGACEPSSRAVQDFSVLTCATI